MLFIEFIENLASTLWGMPFIIFVIVVGLYYMVRSGFFSVFHIGHIMKHTLGAMRAKESNSKRKGRVSPFEAACIAIGGSVGGTNIGGVATAIATGGPGAVFWMWVWALFGMIIKCAEVSLAVYYRSKNEKGDYFGGTTAMIEKAMIKVRGWKWAAIIMWVFGIGFIAQFLGGSQAYTLSETLNTCFGFNPIVVTLFYTALIYYIIFKGIPRIAKFCSAAVPFMCIIYVLGGIVLIIANWKNVPSTFAMIFSYAFTPMAAFGGFAGTTVTHMMRVGISRAINSNEAGQGSSPLIHSSAHTIHPVRQGLWGATEVFVDTAITCSVSALAVLVTGLWSSGLDGATLTVAAFETFYGYGGVVFIGVMMFLFGLTTTAGWFSYYNNIFEHLLRNHPKIRDTCISVFKFVFPIPNVFLVTIITLTGGGARINWAIADICLVIPVFINLVVLVLLNKDFFKLLKDYKARYMGIGTVDPNFKPFFDTPPTKEEMEELEEIAG